MLLDKIEAALYDVFASFWRRNFIEKYHDIKTFRENELTVAQTEKGYILLRLSNALISQQSFGAPGKRLMRLDGTFNIVLNIKKGIGTKIANEIMTKIIDEIAGHEFKVNEIAIDCLEPNINRFALTAEAKFFTTEISIPIRMYYRG